MTWTQIPTVNTAPDETDGYYWVDSHYSPAGASPANTNFLKLVLVNRGVGWKLTASSPKPVTNCIYGVYRIESLIHGA